jgi:ketosteroid isomerase-like protein
MKFLFALLLPLMLVGSPAKADDAKTIAQRLDDSWIAAYNKDDAAGVAALYATPRCCRKALRNRSSARAKSASSSMGL